MRHDRKERQHKKLLQRTQWKSYVRVLKTKTRLKDNNWSERVKIDKGKERERKAIEIYRKIS
jgi:hypothetical protein